MQALGVVWDKVEQEEVEARPLDVPVHFGARLLYDLWRDAAPRGGLIVGRDVPSRSLSPILRNLLLCEPIEERANFRVRLAGAALLRRFGRDITGETFCTVFLPAERQHRVATFRELLHTGEPVMRELTLPQGTRPPLHFEIINVPVLAADGVTPWILGGMFYYDWTG